MALVMGIDIGSGTSKSVLLDDKELVGYQIIPSGVNYQSTARKLREEVLSEARLSENDIDYTMVTGRCSGNIPFGNTEIPDLYCCARGIHKISPSIRGVIDIQRLTIQVINLDESGQVTDFAITERCATSSGYFLEVVANVLQLKISEIGPLSLESKHPVTFTTGCAVFGESEAISRVSEGIPKEDILAGIHKAIADKVFGLINRIGAQEKYAVCGGGALNLGLVEQIERFGIHVHMPPQPQIINAIGAALSQDVNN